ncbi:MAG: hypothetical protein ACUVTZ_07470 [Armatimonadota bacterium]
MTPSSPLPLRLQTLLLTLLGALLVLGISCMRYLPQSMYAHPQYYVPAFSVCFLIYAAAAYLAVHLCTDTRPVLAVIAVVALAGRVVPLVQPPPLSTDIYRYLWDAHIASNGINPYKYPPIARELRPYRTSYWDTINHKLMRTMYPPLSQAFFMAVHKTGGQRLFAYKLAFTLLDLATAALLFLMLAAWGKPLRLAIIYAWHPLVWMEIAGSGHQDALGILLMTAAVFSAGTALKSAAAASDALTGFLAGLSAMAKGYIAPALPILFRRRPLVSLPMMVLAVGPLVAAYWGGGAVMVGLTQYLQNRLRNAGLFDWINQLYAHATPDHLRLTRITVAVLLALIVGRMALKPAKDPEELARRTMASIGAFFLLSHTVYPWYATWLVPLLCVHFSPGWFLFTGIVTMAYLNPTPNVNPWVTKVEYPPVFALLMWEAWRRRRDNGSSPGSGGRADPTAGSRSRFTA